MEITIIGSPEEIAVFVHATQRRQEKAHTASIKGSERGPNDLGKEHDHITNPDSRAARAKNYVR
jgi:hypothetical protein